ncbi:hypothetical protein CEXT_644721 [Caerostris extrusa]|uniref:Uncharacterized protein n=1 Tax=Caerostris extrusa TaxID=172846 RepID=A0AAV4MFF3_CAEEX|nr:hypothetical protein CEXT_644721 [Caerostris extrusa]
MLLMAGICFRPPGGHPFPANDIHRRQKLDPLPPLFKTPTCQTPVEGKTVLKVEGRRAENLFFHECPNIPYGSSTNEREWGT